MEHDETREILEVALSRLSDRDQAVIRARSFDNLSWEAIASLLGSPSVTAAQEHHRRAWLRLREELGEGGAASGVLS